MYCYRFPDRTTFLAICETIGWTAVSEEGEMQLAAYTSDRAVDELGPVTLPVQLMDALPYILVVIILAGVGGKAIPPRAGGEPYVKER